MKNHMTVRQGPLPEDMRILLRDYPRELWPDHPNFAESIQHWMGAHQMFRRLAALVEKDTELFLDKGRSTPDYAGRLAYYGNLLVRNLHGHHGWEDRAFFPELSRADDRFDHGLEVLESDHEALDALLDTFTVQANRTVQLAQLDETQVHDEAGIVHGISKSIGQFLDRHLGDEEDLVVPILLHHKMRG